MHTCTYMYIYVCVCVCFCAYSISRTLMRCWAQEALKLLNHALVCNEVCGSFTHKVCGLFTYIHIYIYIYACIVYIYIYTPTHKYMYICIYSVCAMYIYTHTHAYIYICMYSVCASARRASQRHWQVAAARAQGALKRLLDDALARHEELKAEFERVHCSPHTSPRSIESRNNLQSPPRPTQAPRHDGGGKGEGGRGGEVRSSAGGLGLMLSVEHNGIQVRHISIYVYMFIQVDIHIYIHICVCVCVYTCWVRSITAFRYVVSQFIYTYSFR